MPTRAAHVKSRNGCDRCKQRRVRCDKQEPKCANCKRRNEDCIYQTWRLVAPGSAHETESQDARECRDMNPNVITSLIPTINAPDRTSHIKFEPSIRDLNGLFASISLQERPMGDVPLHAAQPEEVQLWREAVHTNTSSHPYLKLCFTSIYQLFAQRSAPTVLPEEQMRAYRDQIAASNLFRGSNVTINEHNWVAVLIFSVSLIIFQFASQQASTEDIDYMETMHVLKMSAGVLSATGPYLLRSPIWTFIRQRDEMAWQPMDPELSAALLDLQSTVTESTADEPDKGKVMGAAVQALIDWSSLCNGCPRTWKHYVVFPGMASTEYLQLLASGDDLALLVLIYWCAVMRAGASRWFLDKWLPRTVEMARGKLEADWTRVLDWPNAVMNSR